MTNKILSNPPKSALKSTLHNKVHNMVKNIDFNFKYTRENGEDGPTFRDSDRIFICNDFYVLLQTYD